LKIAGSVKDNRQVLVKNNRMTRAGQINGTKNCEGSECINIGNNQGACGEDRINSVIIEGQSGNGSRKNKLISYLWVCGYG